MICRTNPLITIDVAGGLKLNVNSKNGRFSFNLDGISIIQKFLSGIKIDDLTDLSATELQFLYAGILILDGDPAFKLINNWKESHWQRYLTLLNSQQNISYEEPEEIMDNYGSVVDHRRMVLDKYMKEEEYPIRKIKERIEIFQICKATQQPMNLEKNLNRRSCRSFSNQEVGASQFASFITDVSNALTEAEQSKKQDRFFLLNSFYSWTRIFIAVQGVEGLSRGIYELNPANLSLNLIRLNFKDEEFSALIAHQNWFQGGGFIVLIGAQWERYQWLYRHSRAYINLLFQLGELGQELIQSYTNLDLGGWMTPAVDEAKANLLCNLNDADGVDILYFHKIGIPQ